MVLELDIFPPGYSVNPYSMILLFSIAVALLCGAFTILPSLLTMRSPSRNKAAPYECGIEVDDNSITQFDVRFYLVAMLFLVFDCEVVFLFPWSATLTKLGDAGFFSMLFFLLVLALGLVYEWRKKSLDW